MKAKTQIGCAILAALVFSILVWFSITWLAPVDIGVPPRKYPPGNVYPVYEALAKATKALEDSDPKYKRGMELIADQLTYKPKNSVLSAEDKNVIAYAMAKFEPIRTEYLRLNSKPCVVVYEYDPQFLFPEFSQFRQWARVESYLMQELLKEGKNQQALQVYENVFRLSEQISREGVLLHYLVGSALRAIIQVPIGEHLQDFSAQECDQIVQIVRQWLQYRFPMSGTIEQEKYYGISIYHGLQSGKLKGEELFPEGDLPYKMRFARFLNLRWAANEMEQYMNDLALEYRKPYLQQKPLPQPRHPLNQVLMPLIPSLGNVSSSIARGEAMIRMTGCVAAVRAYKLRHGRYPKTLAEAGVQDLNYDPYTGGGFIYKTDPAKGFLVYSVFFDGVDNGGKRPPTNREIPNTDLSPVPYRASGVFSNNKIPPGPPAWLK